MASFLYQWEFLRARLDEGEGLPWIAMELDLHLHFARVSVHHLETGSCCLEHFLSRAIEQQVQLL